MITLWNQKSWNVGTSCSTCGDQGNHWINLITMNYLGCKYLSVQIGITARKTCRNARQQKSPNLRSTFEQAIYFKQNISLPLYRVVKQALSYFKTNIFFEQKMWETAVRKQASDFLGGKEVSGNRCLIFWGGNRCRETGVWIWFQETGVGKQVSCFLVETGVGKQVSCFLLETGVGKQVSGNRCRETGVLIPCGNRCQGNRCLDSIVTEHWMSGNRCQSIQCHMYLRRESVWIQVSG